MLGLGSLNRVRKVEKKCCVDSLSFCIIGRRRSAVLPGIVNIY